MVVDKTKYTDESIKSLSPLEFTRLRPATYLGSNEYSTQLLREIFSNSLDEHIIGHGDIIDVILDYNKNEYSVEDNGQGFPINIEKEGETILQAAFDKFNTSGKYDDDGVYSGASLGLNGIGSKLTNYLSHYLIVYSSNGKKYEKLWFEDGIFVKREVNKDNTNKSGTTVTWSPDEQFFQDVEVNETDIKKLFEDISALCPQLTINLTVIRKEKTSNYVFQSKNGIQDLLNKKIGDKEILSNRFSLRKEFNNDLFDVAITYTSEYSENITAYVNYGLTESGVHIGTVKAALTRQLNKFAVDNNILKKNDAALTQAEISEGLFLVFNIKTTNVKYDSQTKTKVVDLNKVLINNVLNNDFASWLNNNQKDAKIIIEKALVARKVRDAAQKAKEKIRNATTKGKKFINLPTKLIDAYSKNRSECSLYITEGDSAANGLVAKRDGKTQAIFPIRGKVLSCRKATTDKVYANQEISNIVKAIGLDIDKETGKLIYDIKKLRYNQIILAADGDADGLAIRSLLINMFWELCQELVINGHIYVAQPPLFRITTKKNEYVFLKDEAELAKYKKEHKTVDYLVNRNKGLGEQNPDELKYCLLDPTTRNVKKIVVNDVDKAEELLECFFGKDVESRRTFLLDNYDSTLMD